MEKGSFWQRLKSLLCLSFILASLTTTIAQDSDDVSNYVVVGAFEFEENAREWVNFSKSQGLDATYRKNFNRNLYYVLVFQSDVWQESVDKLQEVWKLKKFPDAWVYTGNFGNYAVSAPAVDNPLVEKVEEAYHKTNNLVVEESEADTVGKNTETIEQPEKSKEELRQEVIVEEDSLVVDDGTIDMADYLVFFNLFNAQNLQDVNGEVQVIDAERAKLLQTVKGGEYTSIIKPNSTTGKISMIVETFGYRKMQHDVSYINPLKDTSSIDIDIIGDVLVYHFPLVRYHKGDIVTMYNVYFFKDAAIMMPESRYEVNSLLDMMKENPGYKIKIHGHTNGNSVGQIILAGEDQEFFTLTEDDQETMGSAKKLSRERARVIKDYLVASGIDPDRMEIQAWGGKRMIYDKHSNLAKKNVRVEIEILEE